MSTPRPRSVREALDAILPRVQKPARYLGLERNLVRKAWDSVPLHVALAFPDAYEIGMSHQGSRILYHMINRRPDALAERTYAPWPDMGRALREAGIPLYTLESYRPVADFDVVGLTLQSELNYTNVPWILGLAGITRWARDRGDREPIVLGGGPCTANPEPVADFFDAILVGDAEAALDAILDTIRDARAEGAPRRELLRRLARIEGVYVPLFYRWHPASGEEPARWEVLEEGALFPVRRVWVEELDPSDQPEVPIVPFAEVIQDRLGMEIMRGCTQGCRFCQAGYWYRPVREHDPAVVAQRMERQVEETGFEQVSLLSLSSADYSQVEPLARALAGRLHPRQVSVSLPSLRADAFSVELAEAVSRVRKSGFTFAPETGSDRLRRVINKTFTNADMLAAAEAAFSRGWNLLKVYAMIGLPTETDDDLLELVHLARELVERGRRIRGRKVEVKVSVGCFVPKAWTPFQWEPFCGTVELDRRIRLLRDRFRKVRGARLTWNDPEEAALEAMLSRGDRRLAAAIARAHDLGAVFDGWTDMQNLDAWERAFAETGIDPAAELDSRDPASILPWEIIDAGVRKGYLRAELRRALKEVTTEDCKWGHCYRCGIPGDGEDIRLAPPSLPQVTPSGGGDVQEPPPPHTRPERDRPGGGVSPPSRRHRFTFAKTGDARFLSHRLLMDALARALRGAGLPVKYTEGFNPHIRLSMGPALPLGYEGLAETFDVDCTAPVRPHHLDRVNRLLPEGLRVLDVNPLLAGAPSLGKLAASALYRIVPPADREWPRERPELPGEIAGGILAWTVLPGGTLRVELNLRQSEGPTPTVKQLLAALGVPEEEIPLVRVTRETVRLRARAVPAPETS